jgi:GNAT superfamily N-acetyltransferase
MSDRRDTRPAAAVARLAVLSDAGAMARLLEQLGYPATTEEVTTRLEIVRDDPQAVAFVSEHESVVVGAASACVIASLHVTGRVAIITSMVVDQSVRRHGVGRSLVAAIEQWARDNGAAYIIVSSGDQRADAHAFYEGLGYTRSGVRFRKNLP